MRSSIVAAFALFGASALGLPGAIAAKRDVQAEAAAADSLALLAEPKVDVLTSFFTLVENIPDEVLLAGDNATNAWRVEHGYLSPAAVEPSELPTKRDSQAGNAVASASAQAGLIKEAKCIAAITELIASTLIPAAKLLKLKKLIKLLGGAKKVAKLLLKGSSHSTASDWKNIGGQNLLDLVDEFLDIDDIKSNCF